MKKFTTKNDPFVCEICQTPNPPAAQTCRNHCRSCLHSKHVDIFPGDRANECQGTLKPMGVEFVGGEMKNLTFLCTKCGKNLRNKIAPDDDREALYALMEKSINF